MEIAKQPRQPQDKSPAENPTAPLLTDQRLRPTARPSHHPADL